MNPIQSCISNGVLHVVFNRPDRKNALTTEMCASLCRLLELAALNERVKVLMLSGADGVFTRGDDLDEFMLAPLAPEAPVSRFIALMARFTKPVVAAVEGEAVGIGATVLLHCDLVYAADDARFALPFITHGDMLTAHEAVELGLVNQLLPSQEVLYHAARQAERLALLPGRTMGISGLGIEPRSVMVDSGLLLR